MYTYEIHIFLLARTILLSNIINYIIYIYISLQFYYTSNFIFKSFFLDFYNFWSILSSPIFLSKHLSIYLRYIRNYRFFIIGWETLMGSLWKVISKEWDFFNSRVPYIVAGRKRVKFWKDNWYSEETLNVMFPNLFALSDAEEVWVVDL